MLFPETTLTYESDRSPQAILDALMLQCTQRKNFRCSLSKNPEAMARHRFTLIPLGQLMKRYSDITGYIDERGGRSTVTVTVRAESFDQVFGYLFVIIATVALALYILVEGFKIFPCVLYPLGFFAPAVNKYAFKTDVESTAKLFNDVLGGNRDDLLKDADGEERESYHNKWL